MLKVLNNANIIEKTTGKDNADNKELYTQRKRESQGAFGRDNGEVLLNVLRSQLTY